MLDTFYTLTKKFLTAKKIVSSNLHAQIFRDTSLIGGFGSTTKNILIL